MGNMNNGNMSKGTINVNTKTGNVSGQVNVNKKP